MIKQEVWLITAQGDDGDWYACGYEIHRTRDAAREEAKMIHPGPFRVVRYVPAPRKRKKVKK